jgi:hypothetical protein
MMRGIALASFVATLCISLAGCFEDRYRCTSDEQCDTGTGGRCEPDGSCSSFDLTCTTNFRYTDHSGEQTETCYDDRAEVANACAGGQGPVTPTGCFAAVCDRLKACCETAWTDACVQIAQEECDLSCDTRLALTATRTGGVETWELRWDNNTWTTKANTTLSALSWIAPAPGAVEPRLVGFNGRTLVVGGMEVSASMPPGRTYNSITSVSFDRHGVDTIASSYSDGGEFIELRNLADGATRIASVPSSELLTWGDLNRDGFPDAVAKAAVSYRFYENVGSDDFSRKIVNPTSANVTGGATPGSPQIRSIDWLDFNHDGQLDLAVFGSSIRIHTTSDMLRDVADRELDCSPPNLARSCMNSGEPDLERYSFVGAALPTRSKPELVFAQFPHRKLWRASAQDDAFFVVQMPFPNDGCSCPETCSGGNCTYDCTSCVPVLWIGSRDLDRDHKLDLIAIDARLRIFTAFAANNFAWRTPFQIPTMTTNTFTSVSASISGAPTP